MKFYGQFDPPVDKILYERYYEKYFKNRNDCIAAECGAFDGLFECSCKFFEETLNWEVFNIEASAQIYSALVKNRPKSHNLNYALSDVSSIGTYTFTNVHYPGHELCTNGSMKHINEHMQLLKNQKCDFDTSIVNTKSYSDFIDDNKISHVDILVLDVEGFELAVLKGMKDTTILPKVFCIEYPHLGLTKLEEIILNMGYIRDHIQFNNAYYTKL